VPRLAGIVRHGVGVNTRVGAARFVGQLVLRMGPDVRPASGALIKVAPP
jgi:proteasome component ECM29